MAALSAVPRSNVSGFAPRRPFVIAPRRSLGSPEKVERGPLTPEENTVRLRNFTARQESPEKEEKSDEEDLEQEEEQEQNEREEQEDLQGELSEADEEIELPGVEHEEKESQSLEPEEEADDLIRLQEDEADSGIDEEKEDEIEEESIPQIRRSIFAAREKRSPETEVEEDEHEQISHLFSKRDITYEDLLALERPVKHVEITEDEFRSGVYGGLAKNEEKQESSELEPADIPAVETGLEEVTLPVRCIDCGLLLGGYESLIVKMRREGFGRGEDEDTVNMGIVAEINRRRKQRGLAPIIGCCVAEVMAARAPKNTQLSIEEVVDGVREVVPEEPVQIERLLLTGNPGEVIKQTISAKNYLESRNQIEGLWSEPGAEIEPGLQEEEEEEVKGGGITVPAPLKKTGLTRITLKPTVAVKALREPEQKLEREETVRGEGELFNEGAALETLENYFKRLRARLPTVENPVYIEFRNVPKELNGEPTVRFYANNDVQILGKDKTERLAPNIAEQRALSELDIPYQIFYPVGAGKYVPRVTTTYQISERGTVKHRSRAR